MLMFVLTVTTGGPSGDVGCVNGRRAFEAFLVLTHLSTDELLDPRDAVRARYITCTVTIKTSNLLQSDV
jgi:hypothetical protein